MVASLVSSQNFTKGVVCAAFIFAFIIAQDSQVTACSDGKNSNIHVKASLKPKWMYEVRSPGFPSSYYPSNSNCSWTFTAPGDYEFVLALKHFQVEPSKECDSDYLHVSFTNHSIPNWRKYCSVLSDNYINSLHLNRVKHYVFSEKMTVMFVSDGSLAQFRGFEGEVRLVAPALVPPHQEDEYCVNHLNDTSGNFASPKYPVPYQTDMACTWHLTVPSGKRVYLKFTSFDLENTINEDGECANDYVEIREGVWGRRGGIILGRFCYNDTIPPEVSSPSNQMWVRFISNKDTSNKHKGFHAKFKDSPWSSGSRFLPASFTVICFWVLFVLTLLGF